VNDTPAKSAARRARSGDDKVSNGGDGAGEIMQVERRDYTAIAPEGAARRQSMRGFEPVYADIVDYIVRCTHRIWDEKNPGLIYSHYTHNCVVYGPIGTSWTREEVVIGTIQRQHELPERRGMAYQVIWNGNDVDGFYTSHLVSGYGRHVGWGAWGPPTGRTFHAWTIADCVSLDNKIYREWLVRDNMAMILNLGLDAEAIARNEAAGLAAKGVTLNGLGHGDRILGQLPPAPEADLSICADDEERRIVQALHTIWNLRMFGLVRDIYSPRIVQHAPCGRRMRGPAQVIGHITELLSLMPDAQFTCHHIATNPTGEGGHKVAVRWDLVGRHLGHSRLGKPTGKPLYLMGMTHFHIVDGKVVEEWMIYDELALRVQLQLPEG
jgi:predicted ester cyclase